MNKPYLMAGGALLTGLAIGGTTGYAAGSSRVPAVEYRNVTEYKTPETCTTAIQTLIDSNLEASLYRELIYEAASAANVRDVEGVQYAMDEMHEIDANLDQLMIGLEADVNDCRSK